MPSVKQTFWVRKRNVGFGQIDCLSNTKKKSNCFFVVIKYYFKKYIILPNITLMAGSLCKLILGEPEFLDYFLWINLLDYFSWGFKIYN